MHNLLPKKYYFIDKFKKSNIDKLNNNTAIIYRNYSKKLNKKKILELKNYCKKKKIKFLISNNIKLAYKLNLDGAVMASDAFFPFPDCVEIAFKNGIKSVIQPGGSIKDQLSIDFCDKNSISMVMTGNRHFKH